MTTAIPITCDNCGAKYKLPETFKGNQAKCQKCGSVIDVAKQRAAPADAAGTAPASPNPAARPAEARPAAAARPAVDRSKIAARDTEPAKAPASRAPASSGAASSTPAAGAEAASSSPSTSSAAGGRAAAKSAPAGRSRTRKAAAADAEDGDEKGGRRGRPAKKSNTMPLAMTGIGVVAIVIVVIFMMTRDDKARENATAAKSDPAANAAAAPAAGKPAEPAAPNGPSAAPGKPAAAPNKPADAPAKPADPAPAKTPTDPKPTDAAAPAPAPAPVSTTNADGTPKKRWELVKGISSMADVRDPKSYPEVVWPASIDDAKKAQIRALCDDVQNGGRPGIRAKKELRELGFEALFGIVDKLRNLDYKVAEDSMVALELFKLLEELTGINSGFENVEPGEEIDPRKAEYNTLTFGKWRTALDKMPTAEAYQKIRADQLKKQGDDGK